MSNPMKRREFLATSTKALIGLGLSTTLVGFSTKALKKSDRPNLNLIKDPNSICDLPNGFNYTVISKADDIMSDGNYVPERHDGMACFNDPNGHLILVRNHEMGLVLSIPSIETQSPEFAYDESAIGGTVTIHLNEKLEVEKHFLSLNGTTMNCGGGKTPWGTWISCEETDGSWPEGWMLNKRHGYNFEVNPLEPIKKAVPLKAMGRFKHEAIAVDPHSGIVYQTEDQMNSCFYRFIPKVKQQMAEGGVLQALKFVDQNIKHTSDDPIELDRNYPVEWVTIENPDPIDYTTRDEAQAKGAAIFIRGEGISAYGDGIYFACTMGGKDKAGQIFKYTPNANDANGTIKLVYEAMEDGILERPDNITLNNFGDLIICEDNSYDERCLVGLTPEGHVYYIASNTMAEWAGACFSPDGKILFANIQKPGLTVAIRGPWETLRTV